MIRKRATKIILEYALVVAFILLINIFCFSFKTYAANYDDSILKKWAFAEFSQCINTVAGGANSVDSKSDGNMLESIFGGKFAWKPGSFPVQYSGNTEANVRMTSGATEPCKDKVMEKVSNYSKSEKINQEANWANESERSALLTVLGLQESNGKYKVDSKKLREKIMSMYGAKNISELNLDTNERYTLYEYYLRNTTHKATNSRVDSIGCGEAAHDRLVELDEGGSTWRTVKLIINGEVQTCYAYFGSKYSPNDISVYTLSGPLELKKITMKDVIDWINANVESVDGVEGSINQAAFANESDGSDCESADLNGQGWWLCPVLTNATYTANWVDNIIADWLEVDNNIYGDESATYAAWGVMRNIANVLMIIFLLVIIFSQLTGFGINNYGIKKMLPRFVVMAILINLSFIICEIAVDLSNVLGIGLRNLFGAVGGGMQGSSSGAMTNFLATIVSSLLAVAGVGGAIAGTAVTIIPIALAAVETVALAPVIIIIIILALIPVLFAVILFFVMLGARMIIVIGCIAIAPIAFALFILPNTQSVFKKWWSLFKAALILFPICGAVGGISTLIKGMVLSLPSIEVPMAIVGMIAPYLPFFALPSLLKGAIGMLGSMGTALTSMGERIRSGAKSGMEAIQRTGAYQDATKFAQEEAAYRRANRVLDRFKNLTPEQRKNLSKRQQMRLFEAENLRNSRMMEGAQAETGAYLLTEDEVQRRAESARDAQEFKGYTDRFTSLTRSEMGDELEDAAVAYSRDRSRTNAIRLQAAISSAEGRGMNKEILGSSLGDLALTAGHEFDAKILNQLAGSNDRVLSQYGRQMPSVSELDPNDSNKKLYPSQSFNSFTSQGVSFAGKEISLKNALNKIGPSALNGANDDTLNYIRTKGSGAVSSNMLINAAANASNNKELVEINEMLKARNADTIGFSDSDLAKFDLSTVSTLVGKAASSPALQQMLVQTYASVKSNPNLLGQLKPDVKNILDLVEQEVGQISVAAQSAAATQTATSTQPSGLLDANGNPIPSSGIDIQLPPRRS